MKSRIIINCVKGIIINGISIDEMWVIGPYHHKKFTLLDKVLWLPLEKIKCKAPWFGYEFKPGSGDPFVHSLEDQYVKNIYKSGKR